MSHNSEQKLVIYWSTKKIISLICAVLIIPTILVFIFSWTLKQTVINPEYYKNNFKKVNAASRLINEGIPSLILESKDKDSKFQDSLAKDLIILVLQKSVDPVWIDSLIDRTIDQVVIFFSKASRTDNKININLGEAKSFLTKVSDGLIILEQIIPTCADAQSSAEATKLLGNSINCQKMTMDLDEIKTEIVQTRTIINNVNVGVVDISETFSQANSYILFLQNFIRQINTAFYTSMIILIVLILLIIILEYKNLVFVLKSISLPLIIGSVLGLLIIWPIRSLSINNLNLIDINLSAAMKSIVIDILHANINGVFLRFELIAGIIFGLFAIIYILTWILEKNKILKNQD